MRRFATMGLDKSKCFSALLFVLCGVPGLFVMMVSTFQLVVSVYDPSASDVHIHPLILVATSSAGALLMLVGVGLWKKWGYLLVFAVIPGSVCFLIMLNPRGSGISVSFAAIVAICTFSTLYLVKRLYQKRPGPTTRR